MRIQPRHLCSTLVTFRVVSITRGIAELDTLARDAASGAEQSQAAARSLGNLAARRLELVGKCKV